MTGFVAMPGSLGPWRGGRFEAAHCVLAPNPGPMTLDGTNTWLIDVDADSVILVDPGPDDPAHLRAVRGVLPDRRVREIWLTHGHADHSAGARLFADAFGCRVRALTRRTDSETKVWQPAMSSDSGTRRSGWSRPRATRVTP